MFTQYYGKNYAEGFGEVKVISTFPIQEKRPERCGKKIKMGRYCYYCGKYKGLW